MLRRILVAAAILLPMTTDAFSQDGWLRADAILIRAGSPTAGAPVVNVHTPVYPRELPFPNAWHTVDMSQRVPPEAVAIHLTGMLIITRGQAVELPQLTVEFRSEDGHAGSPLLYTTSPGDGNRELMSVWVPLSEARTFQYRWSKRSDGNPWWLWPHYSAYAINLHMDAIAVRDE